MIKIQDLTFPSDSRIIVISDIHGSLEIFKRLLKKVDYHPNQDFLILLGDFAQKGKEPLKTLRFIMELSRLERVYPVLGNCDRGNYKVFFDEWLETEFKKLLDQKGSVLYDMKKEYSMLNPSFDELSLKEKQITLSGYFKEEITFLKSLPLMIDTPDFIFVHAGIDKIRDYRMSYFRTVYMKRYFYYQGHLSDKIVVCGHMPVTIYQKDEFNDNIIIDLKKKIISIDGGMVVKEGGQLNALIINYEKGKYLFSTAYEDGLKRKKLMKPSIKNNRGKGICWPNYDVEVLDKREYFTKVRVVATGDVTYLKNEYLRENKAFDDAPASILGINRGEEVGIVNDNFEGYVLVKYHGTQGWVEKGVFEDEN